MEVECIRRPCCEAYKEVEPALSRELRSERERVAQLLGSLPFGSVLAIFVLSACLAQSRMSPIAFRHTVICTRCSHLKRSRKLCFAVAIVPFAIGSASLPVESILAKNQIKNTPAEVHETWRRRAKQGNTVHAHQNFRPTLSLSRATRITLHLRHSYAVVPSCQASGEILAHRRLSLVLPNPAAQHLATMGHRYSRLSSRWFSAICRPL